MCCFEERTRRRWRRWCV
uniref:Uncharacterized protein n=1 Tax=Arundo donax TaxID=35708 RepID=A0A0A9AM69_ARUDO